jgi:hypothetical protein
MDPLSWLAGWERQGNRADMYLTVSTSWETRGRPCNGWLAQVVEHEKRRMKIARSSGPAKMVHGEL